MTRRSTLIVEPGRSRGALAGARALRLAGWEVGVAYPAEGLAAYSRACRWRHTVPRPETDPDGFVAAVNAACARAGHDLVFGCDDAEVLLLCARRDEIAAEVAHASQRAVSRALDKAELARLATAAGFRVPPSFAADDPDLPDVPLVVKAKVHRRTGPHRAMTEAVAGRDDARAVAAELAAGGDEPFFQERVEGPLMALCVVAARDGRVVAAVQQVSDRLFPPASGMSAVATTVPVDRELLGRAESLLRELGWFGLAQLQFVCPPDSEPALIDLNGRFYGSMSLALAAGVNLPAIWAAMAVGEPPAGAPLLGRPGMRYQWLEGDFRRALAERRGGLARDLGEVLRPRRRVAGAIWSARDPLPAALHTLRLGSLAVDRLVRRGPRR